MSNFSVNAPAPKAPVSADFHGERSTAPDAPIFDGPAIFGTESEEYEPTLAKDTGPVAAKIERLFSVLPNIRLDSTQPHHFADVVRGLRETPQAKHVITRAPTDKGSSTYPVVLSHEGQVFLPQIIEDGYRAVINSLDTRTGTLKSINVDTGGYLAKVFLNCASATPTEAVFAWRASVVNPGPLTLMVTCVDAIDKEVRWTRAISNQATDSASFIRQTLSGDFAVLCGLSHSNARLLILDKVTGVTKYECGLPPEDASHFDETPLAPIFFNGNRNDTAVVGLTLAREPRSHFYSVDFATGEMKKIGASEVPLTTSSFVQLSKGNSLLLPFPWEDQNPQRVRFSDDHTFQMTPFELPIDFYERHLVLNRNQKYAVAPSEEGISFFSIADTKLELLEQLPLPKEVNWRGAEPPMKYTAMTADDVVYHSRAMRHENDEIVYCLYAFDAATREELWTVEHAFKSPPAVVVNDNGSITWVSCQTAVILGS